LAPRRIEQAQRLPETTEESVDSIAFLTGFGTATSLRQHFSATLKTSPIQYRRLFLKQVPA
jgi:AraC family transcriptional activator FtrA